MDKKRLLLFSLFFATMAFNIFLSITLISKNEKIASINRVLDEISNGQNIAMQTKEKKHVKVANLKTFFRKYNSPLYDHAEQIVNVSEKYGFYYGLLPAIAMQESGLCRHIPKDSHNCWGWGVYGGVVTKFSSYDEAIETVAKGIRRHYLDRGLVTVSKIMEKYTPSSNGSWARGVNGFLDVIE